MNALFKPIRIGAREVKNRLVKTATFETMGTPDGYITQQYVDWYAALARGGVGMIHTGIVYPQAAGQASPHEVGIEKDERIAGFRRLAEAVHQYDGLILAQLHHPGRQFFPTPDLPGEVVGPSPVRNLISRITPRQLTIAEIEGLISAWAAAARRAEEAGLDGVQLHIAHGYLIHAFISGRTNRRTDVYGGSLDDRLKLVRDLVAAVRAKTGPTFLVTVKINGADGLPPGGVTPRIAADVAERISSLPIDAIEVSRGTYEYPSTVRGDLFFPLMLSKGLGKHLPSYIKAVAYALAPVLAVALRYREGFNMDAVRLIRPKTRKPLIALGGFKTPSVMARIVESGEADMISMGRQLVADPDLPNKIRDGGEINVCTFCNKCIALVGVKPALCYKDVDVETVSPPISGAIRDHAGDPVRLAAAS
ncbi:MAG: NADH:flavin oxidoreductase [Nitrospirae bacterium]|nr:NADH:flavin oxidoreductase [Nitrospirota bacterium]